MRSACCCCPRARSPLCEPLAPELRNEMEDIRAQMGYMEHRTEQNNADLCSLRGLLDVFANLLISAVDKEMDRRIDERLGVSPETDSSRGD